MQTVAFYGFGSWVPTLLIAKGILVTTSQNVRVHHRHRESHRTAAGNAGCRPHGAQVANRFGRRIALPCLRPCSRIKPIRRLVIAFGVAVTLSNNWMSFAFHNYQGELFPTRIRARAVGFVYSWSRVSAAFASLMINFLLVRGGAPAVAGVHRRGHAGDDRDHRRVRPPDPAA